MLRDLLWSNPSGGNSSTHHKVKVISFGAKMSPTILSMSSGSISRDTCVFWRAFRKASLCAAEVLINSQKVSPDSLQLRHRIIWELGFLRWTRNGFTRLLNLGGCTFRPELWGFKTTTFGFVIKDLRTRRVLMRGQSKGDLYQFALRGVRIRQNLALHFSAPALPAKKRGATPTKTTAYCFGRRRGRTIVWLRFGTTSPTTVK